MAVKDFVNPVIVKWWSAYKVRRSVIREDAQGPNYGTTILGILLCLICTSVGILSLEIWPDNPIGFGLAMLNWYPSLWLVLHD